MLTTAGAAATYSSAPSTPIQLSGSPAFADAVSAALTGGPKDTGAAPAQAPNDAAAGPPAPAASAGAAATAATSSRPASRPSSPLPVLSRPPSPLPNLAPLPLPLLPLGTGSPAALAAHLRRGRFALSTFWRLMQTPSRAPREAKLLAGDLLLEVCGARRCEGTEVPR